MPYAAAAFAIATSPPGQPKPTAPVGAIAIGIFASTPKTGVEVSTEATLIKTLGKSRTRSKAWRFARSVISSSAPPSKNSNTERGSRARAARRRSSIEIASDSIRKHADGRVRHLHEIAGLERRHGRAVAAEPDHVAGMQRHVARRARDVMRDAEDHAARVVARD